MNILELISKSHSHVRVECCDHNGTWQAVKDPQRLITKALVPGKVKPRWHRLWDRLRQHQSEVLITNHIRGLRLEPGTRVVIREAARHWPEFSRGEGLFYLRSLTKTPADIHLAWLDQGSASGRIDVQVGALISEVRPSRIASSDADLVVEAPATGRAPVFLGVHRLLDRSALVVRCKGRGVEIGPGPKPQILPAPNVDVSYVEQASPEDWIRLYGKDTKMPVDPSLWKRYVVGNADQIPVEPNSLDFVFSSHVIEHLANPLGHLKYWASLLREGGMVAAVIPDMEGCKDFVFQPSSMDELMQEYQTGDMQVKLHHYARWGEHRAPSSDPAQIMASGRSIHVHFYTPRSMRAILEAHHRELGFRRCEVISSPNHKDFYVLLEK